MSVNTLYIRNLNQKVSPNRLKAGLLSVFEEHGFTVVDVKTFKSVRLRGQSFVTLPTNEDCLRAVHDLSTEFLLGSPMDVRLAKTNSDTAVKESMKKADPQSYEEGFDKYVKDQREIRFRHHEKGNAKRSREEDMPMARKKARKVSKAAPNKTLLLTDLPDSVTEDTLFALFDKFKGFHNLTLVSVRHVAIVEFDTEEESAICLQEFINGVPINDATAILQFAKK